MNKPLMKSLIVIPTYNESENIERLVERIFNLGLGLEILVVDDNSPDGTGELAERLAAENERVHVLHRAGKLGLGSAYVEGFRYALSNGYDLIFEMDADFSHDPSYLADFLDKISQYDVVLGSRYLTGVNVVNWPLKRLLLSYYANWLARVVTRLPVRDSTGGFKCFRREVLESIGLNKIHSEGYAFQIEMNFRAWKKGFRICEIPIIFYDRRRGKSKLSSRDAREAAWMIWKFGLLNLMGTL